MLWRVHPSTAELKHGFTYKFLSLSLFLSMQQLIISIFLLLFLRFCFSQPHQPLVYLQKSNKVNSSFTINSWMLLWDVRNGTELRNWTTCTERDQTTVNYGLLWNILRVQFLCSSKHLSNNYKMNHVSNHTKQMNIYCSGGMGWLILPYVIVQERNVQSILELLQPSLALSWWSQFRLHIIFVCN